MINLLVAKSIPSLADLDISGYLPLADQWADAVRETAPQGRTSLLADPVGLEERR